jgi:hypothetical protein
MTNRKILTKWLNSVISSKSLQFLPLKYKWIKMEILYQFYIHVKVKGEEAPPHISHRTFIHNIRRISEMNEFVFTDRKTIQNSKAMYILIIQNKKNSSRQIDDYSIFNGPLNGLLFSPVASLTPPTTIPPVSTSIMSPPPPIMSPPPITKDHCPTSITVHYAEDNNLSTIRKNHTDEGQVMDPLNLLAEIAASFPNRSNISNNNNNINIDEYNNNNNNNSQHDNINVQHPFIPSIVSPPRPITIKTHPITKSDFLSILPLLNMNIRPRWHPIDNTEVPMKCNTAKTAKRATRLSILFTLLDCGYNMMDTNERKSIVHAVSTYFSYVGGYSILVCTYNTFRKWHSSYIESKRKGLLVEMFEDKRGDHKLPYITRLEREFPGFIHECYRYSTSICGSDAQLDTILDLMQEYAKTEFHYCNIRSQLSLSKHHFYTFFNLFKGKYQSPTTKPRLTTEHIEKRLEWALKWSEYKNLPSSKKHFCFLDEKWFYTSSRRRKQRILPPHPLTESSEDAFVAKKKVRSRRFPTKVMFQGIITKPYPEHGFNGQISLKRVSKQDETKKLSFNKKFDDSYHITNLLKNNEWVYTCAIDSKTTVQESIDEIQHVYGLHDNVAERLCFSFHTFSKTRKKKIKRMYMGENGEGSCALLLGKKKIVDKSGKTRLLTLEDLDLHVRVPRHSKIERDMTCDSTFMLQSVDETGDSIRSTLHWIPKSEAIILFMDNAGGHGTDESKKEYVSILRKKYNIWVEWQIPNSPETNLLDLGFWATHQAIVERLHRLKRMEVDALARTVRDTFFLVDSEKIDSIFKRWELVLTLIIKGNGTNDLVETRRGLTKSLVVSSELERYARSAF